MKIQTRSVKNLKDRTLSSMEFLNISPKRSMGQNFLINDSSVSAIIKAAKPESFDRVFEVGPGLGALTNPLREKSKDLILLEFDKKLCHFWNKQGFEVRQVNALCFDWKKELDFSGSKLLVSNPPYQIASRLLVELSILEQSFDRMVLMFQKEVAKRILAGPGTRDYGFLTVIAKSFWNIRFVLEAGTVDFFPKPRVASQVLCFDRKKPTNLKWFSSLVSQKKRNSITSVSLEEDFPHFHDFVKKVFMNRRKKLLPKLINYAEKPNLLEIFKKMNLNEKVRVEELTPEQFVKLILQLKK